MPCASTYAIVRGLDAGERLRRRDDLHLPVHARRRVADLAGAVVVDGGAVDHGVDRVAVGERVGQALEHDDAGAGPGAGAARLGVERAAVPSGEKIIPS